MSNLAIISGGSLMNQSAGLLDWPFLVVRGVLSGVSGLEGGIMINTMVVRYCTYVKCLERLVILLKILSSRM